MPSNPVKEVQVIYNRQGKERASRLAGRVAKGPFKIIFKAFWQVLAFVKQAY